MTTVRGTHRAKSSQARFYTFVAGGALAAIAAFTAPAAAASIGLPVGSPALPDSAAVISLAPVGASTAASLATTSAGTAKATVPTAGQASAATTAAAAKPSTAATQPSSAAAKPTSAAAPSAAPAGTTATATTTAVTPAAPAAAALPAAPAAQQLHPVAVTAGQTSVAPTAEQSANAASIVHTGQSLGLPPRAWVIALATSLQETKLQNIGDQGTANDHDSLGLFQQRPSAGWGTPAQIQDPVYAATSFYQNLTQVPGWDTMALTDAAQSVQVSAFGDRYAQWETEAGDLVAATYGTGPYAAQLAGVK